MDDERKEVTGQEAVDKIFKSIASKASGTPSSAMEDDNTYYQREIRKTRARRELEEEEKRLRELDEPPPAPPVQFEVRGGVNLGEIDLQEMQRQQQEKADRDRILAAEREERLRKEVEESKQMLYEKQVESLRNEFASKLDSLQRALENGHTSSKSFKEQFSEAQEIAQQMGFAKTEIGTDPKMELELKKLEWQMKKEDREFSRQMKRDEREFQLRIEELKEQRLQREKELQQQAKRDNMIASFPQQIGGAIAKGMISSEDDEAPRTHHKMSKKYHIEADEGSAGEIDCPNCHSTIAIGPTARRAVCVECKSQFEIKRVPGTKSTEAAKTETYEEDE